MEWKIDICVCLLSVLFLSFSFSVSFIIIFNCKENLKFYLVGVFMCEILYYLGRENYLDDFIGE